MELVVALKTAWLRITCKMACCAGGVSQHDRPTVIQPIGVTKTKHFPPERWMDPVNITLIADLFLLIFFVCAQVAIYPLISYLFYGRDSFYFILFEASTLHAERAPIVTQGAKLVN